jgi:hypothetical protein
MDSLQKAVKAFLSVFDDRMLDRWIPDEDWVPQIGENGDKTIYRLEGYCECFRRTIVPQANFDECHFILWSPTS